MVRSQQVTAVLYFQVRTLQCNVSQKYWRTGTVSSRSLTAAFGLFIPCVQAFSLWNGQTMWSSGSFLQCDHFRIGQGECHWLGQMSASWMSSCCESLSQMWSQNWQDQGQLQSPLCLWLVLRDGTGVTYPDLSIREKHWKNFFYSHCHWSFLLPPLSPPWDSK